MKFYRYEAQEYASLGIDGEYESSSIPNPVLQLREYNLFKETPKGYWICLTLNKWSKPYWKKWVSKTSRKKYAYLTKEDALTNYIKRTERRVKILKRQIWASEISLSLAKMLVIK
jgi:hypothetical protein